MAELIIKKENFQYHSIKELEPQINIDALPITIRILLENVLRHSKNEADWLAFAQWKENRKIDHEISFFPSRVLMQDFTGVPAIVDLAAMRDAMLDLQKDPRKINPVIPVDLVIDHSVQVDYFGSDEALEKNTELEIFRNKERYQFLRWGQSAFENFRVVPPGTGICHQVNLEYLAKVVWQKGEFLFPDTVVGTDSHTTMINGLGVLGWGVGGIEAESAMLGRPIPMKVPEVVGVKLIGQLQKGITATDLTLYVTNILRSRNVVGKFVEFFGEGLKHLTLADRATIANMSPEYGATCGFFPIDEETLRYLELTGRDEQQVKIVKEYAQVQGLWHDPHDFETIAYTEMLIIDLSKITHYMAGPKRPQDLVALPDLRTSFVQNFDTFSKNCAVDEADYSLKNGDVVIAAITSCTNTSNPFVLVGAGLIARKAKKLGLKVKPWVKTSFAPGSQVVSSYLDDSGLQNDLDDLGFNIVGYGCTTCIGNSGPLSPEITAAIQANDLAVAGVLSGNRNFEGRINPHVKANYLASPMLVVIFALIGTVNINLKSEPIGQNKDGEDIFLQDLWPDSEEIESIVDKYVKQKTFIQKYKTVFEGDEKWLALKSKESDNEEIQTVYPWSEQSTYIQKPTFFRDINNNSKLSNIKNIQNAQILAIFGDSITTDHISPAGNIKKDSPAGLYLLSKGIEEKDFNSYGARRGNHEVMMRGTFANIRIKNKMMRGSNRSSMINEEQNMEEIQFQDEGGHTIAKDDVEGGFTIKDGQEMSIFDAATQFKSEGNPTVILAGKEYGTGSSRDWAAKGTMLLGIKAVIAQSFERIHRSNLVGMGVLPLLWPEDLPENFLDTLSGQEIVDLIGLEGEILPKMTVKLHIKNKNNQILHQFDLQAAINTSEEIDYLKNGSILHDFLLKS